MVQNQDDYNCLTCHIVGLNPITKKELIDEINKRVFNAVDLSAKICKSNKKRKLDEYLSATTTKYFTTDDSLGYMLKLLKINNIEDLINFICKGTINDSDSEPIDHVKKFILQRGCDYEKHVIENILDNNFVVQIEDLNNRIKTIKSHENRIITRLF